jgi:type I restriction enzyme S subunit
MLSAKHVRDDAVDFSSVELISEGDFLKCLRRCAPTENDVLVVSVGATTGRAGIVGRCEPFAIVRSVLLLRPLVVPRFLLRWIQSPWCQAYIGRASGSSAQAHLYIQDTRKIPVPLAPVRELSELVRLVEEQFDSITHTQHDVEVRMARAGMLRQAILQHAFSGKLVPHDPNEEPASELLKRIAAERAARPAVTKAKSPRRPKTTVESSS